MVPKPINSQTSGISSHQRAAIHYHAIP